MKHHLNTLFVTTQNAWLHKEGECVALRSEGVVLGKIPIHTLDSIVCFGQISCSPPLMGHCAENGVPVTWMSETGRFLATVRGPVAGNVLLRREQYRWADQPEKSAGLARSFTVGKLANCRTILLRHAREYPKPAVKEAASRLSDCLTRLTPDQPTDSVRGIEGEAAHAYFGVFDELIAPETGFRFPGRSRRPPRDAVNCLLSFLYALLANDIRSALEASGLDPTVGFLHRDRPGRPGLALDMMEEFRPYLADRLALTLINRRQLKPSDFLRTESGAVLLKEKPRKEVLIAWQERKREEVEHPFLKKKMTVGLLWQMQARLLARHVRGELDAYPPFVIR